MKLEVHFFRTKRGSEPVREWLRKLSKEDKKIMGEDIKTVQFGWPRGMPLLARKRKKLYSLGEGKYRILDPTNTAITLNSLVKVAHALGKKTEICFIDD